MDKACNRSPQDSQVDDGSHLVGRQPGSSADGSSEKHQDDLNARLLEEGYYKSDLEEEGPTLEELAEKEYGSIFPASDDEIGTREGGRVSHSPSFGAVGEHTPLVSTQSMGDVRWASDVEDEYYDARQPEPVYGIYDNDGRAQKAAVFIGAGSFAVFMIVLFITISGLTALVTSKRVEKFEISSDWEEGGRIPIKYGCYAEDGGPISMPISWRNVPGDAKSIVVLVHNPGAIRTSKRDPLHWFVIHIPVGKDKDSGKKYPNFLPANASYAGLMPRGAVERPNSGFKNGTYWPLCSNNHSNLFALYVFAVDADPVISNFNDAREILNRFGGVPQSKLTGWYGPAFSKRKQK